MKKRVPLNHFPLSMKIIFTQMIICILISPSTIVLVNTKKYNYKVNICPSLLLRKSSSFKLMCVFQYTYFKHDSYGWEFYEHNFCRNSIKNQYCEPVESVWRKDRCPLGPGRGPIQCEFKRQPTGLLSFICERTVICLPSWSQPQGEAALFNNYQKKLFPVLLRGSGGELWDSHLWI